MSLLLGGFGALYVGCTQDFNQFEPNGLTGGATTTATGTASTTTTTTSSSGGGAGAAGGAGGAGGVGGAGGAGGGPLEDCLNGGDDDGDGDEDCADADCMAGFSCVPDAPGAWEGPAALFDGDPAAVPGCPPAFPDEDYLGRSSLVPEPAICAACTCSAPDVTCTLAPLTFASGGPTCANPLDTEAQPTMAGDCQTISPPGGTTGYKAAAPVADAEPCNEAGGAATLPAVNWANGAVLCGGAETGGGCPGSAVCAPRPAGPFVSGQCVWRDGDFPCPSGYGDRHVLYDEDDYDDTRDCTSCACGDPTAACDVTTEVFMGAACAGAPIVTVVNDNSCELGAIGGSIETTITTTGSCAPTGGAPTGAITEGTNPITVCCI